MGVFQPGLLTDFDCEEVNEVTLNDANQTATLAEVEVTARDGNTVWFTAHVTWVPSNNANNPFTLSIVRENNSIVCTALDSGTSAGRPITTAITCCDVVDEGTYTYRLVGQRVNPTNIEIQSGNFAAAVINTDPMP